jgi:hypothetical protein
MAVGVEDLLSKITCAPKLKPQIKAAKFRACHTSNTHQTHHHQHHEYHQQHREYHRTTTFQAKNLKLAPTAARTKL